MGDSTQKEGSSVQKMFEGHQLEIQRRNESAQMAQMADNSDHFERVETDKTFPFEMEDNKFCLFSVSSVAMPPFSENAAEPGIRILGCFATQEEALQHAKLVQSLDKSCNVQLTACHQWVVAAASPERLADDEKCRAHVAAVLRYYSNEEASNTDEFKTNVKQRRGGTSEPDKDKRRRERLGKEAEEIAQKMYGERGRALTAAVALSRLAEVRGQEFCVVSFLPDRLQPIPEPVFKVYGCFSSLEDADIYCRNTAGHYVKEHDFDIISMYGYVHPQNVDRDKLQKECFRSQELDAIIRQHKKAPGEVAAFKEWREKPAAGGGSSSSTAEGGDVRDETVSTPSGEAQIP